jgi:quercetin dioxygenase-like cupin family protein
MQITRNGPATDAGPDEWFTGDVYMDAVASSTGPYRVNVGNIRFTPGARTAWHSHPNGQTIFVTEGMGLVQQRGGRVETVHAGDRVFFEPGEDHWHGAAPNRFMSHLSVVQVADDGTSATWGDHVTDAEYAAGAAP